MKYILTFLLLPLVVFAQSDNVLYNKSTKALIKPDTSTFKIANGIPISVKDAPYNALGDNSNDDTAEIQAALNTGYDVYFPNGTYKISAAIKPIRNGQKLYGESIRGTIIRQVTSSEHGIHIDSPFISSDSVFGSGAFFVSISNMTVRGPGAFNAGTGAFSGSTGYGLAAMNSGGTYAGDFLIVNNVCFENWDRAVHINGFGNCNLGNLTCEYGNHGLVIGNGSSGNSESNGAGTNGIKVGHLVTSNNAGYSVWWCAGFGNHLTMGDTNSAIVGTGVPIRVAYSQLSINLGNCEQMTTSGKIVDIAFGSDVMLSGGIFSKGSSTTDGSPIRVSADCRLEHFGLKNNGYTSDGILAADGAKVVGFSPLLTMKIGTRSFAATNILPYISTSIPTAAAANAGRLIFSADTSGTSADTVYLVRRKSDGSTFENFNLDLTQTANTWAQSQTLAASKRWNLGAPASGGGIQFLGTGGGSGRTFGIDWERYIQGDFSINMGTAGSGSPTANYFFIDGPNNRTHIGHAAASQPSGTKTCNIEGTLGVTGVITAGSGPTTLTNAAGSVLGAAVDVTGTTAETAIASDDEILIRDASAIANRKATLANIGIPILSSTNLGSQVSQVGNVGSGEDDLWSITIPANTLNTNGQAVRFYASGSIASGKTCNVKYYFGGSSFNPGGSTVGPATWTLEGEIIRTGASSQKILVKAFNFTNTPACGFNTAAATLSGSVTLKITGESTAAPSDNDVTLEFAKAVFEP